MRLVDRPYQHAAVHGDDRFPGIYRSLREHRSSILVLPTGCGKTLVFSRVVAACVKRGKRALILAHREELIEGAREKLIGSTDVDPWQVGVEMASSRAADHHGVVIGSVQTLKGERLRRLPASEFGLVVVDEAHHSTAKSYKTIIEHFPDAKILGVTATPDRMDGQGLGKVFASVAYVYEIADAIRDGYLVRVTGEEVLAGSAIDLSGVRTTAGDLNQGDLAEVLERDPAVALVAKATADKAGSRPTILFAVSVAQARAVAAYINTYLGREAAMALDGTAPRDVRRAVKQRFERGDFQFLCNCLDKETELLTRRGWLGMDDVRVGDMTASINPENDELVWTEVFHVIKRPRAKNERMVRIKNQTLDVRVTEGHRMLVRSRGAKGWNIEGAYRLPVKLNSYELPMAGFGEPDSVDLTLGSETTTPVKDLSLDDCRFIGLWITDGYLDRSADKRGITISQSQCYKEANDEIQRLLTACGFDWKMRERKYQSNIHSDYFQNLYSVPRGSILSGSLVRRGYLRLEDYLSKDFNPVLFGLNRDQAKALIEGMWLGDGVKEKGRKKRNDVRTSWHIVNTNKKLLDSVQRLAVTRGMAANLNGPKYNGPMATMPIYVLAIRDRSKVITNNVGIATSGGNPSSFEDDYRPEPVWCVSNRLGTIITRRRGKVVGMGQCALYTEGVDIPSIACVAIARPTKSRALYSQMVGRGTRLLGATIEESIANGKDSVHVLDFSGVSGKHRLVTCADVLDGNTDEEVRRRVIKLASAGPVDIMRQLEIASEEIAEESRRKALADVQYRVKAMADPFALLGVHPRAGRFGGRRATTEQLERLARHKIPGAAEQLQRIAEGRPAPAEPIDYGQASEILNSIGRRVREGKCSVRMAAILMKHGLNPDASFDTARWALDQIAGNRWRPTQAVLEHPELRAK